MPDMKMHDKKGILSWATTKDAAIVATESNRWNNKLYRSSAKSKST